MYEGGADPIDEFGQCCAYPGCASTYPRGASAHGGDVGAE